MTMQPFKCPICNGTGMVYSGFYGVSNSTNPEKCKTCSGTGIVMVGIEPKFCEAINKHFWSILA